MSDARTVQICPPLVDIFANGLGVSLPINFQIETMDLGALWLADMPVNEYASDFLGGGHSQSYHTTFLNTIKVEVGDKTKRSTDHAT